MIRTALGAVAAQENAVSLGGAKTKAMNEETTVLYYHRRGHGAVALSVLGCIVTWSLANTLYATSQSLGWVVGLIACALPAGVAAGYLLWLRRQRLRGIADARVPWMIPVLVLEMLFFLGMLLFSLM